MPKHYVTDVTLGSYDGTWHVDHNGTTFVAISQLLVESHDFLWNHLAEFIRLGCDFVICN